MAPPLMWCPAVKFSLVDRIIELSEGEHITAIKALTLTEEYLGDHFPRFPVMPGVMMLEAMYQTSAWLIRKSEDFANTVVVLHEARNVKFSSFVEPGQILVMTAKLMKQSDTMTTLKAEATVEGKTAVTARLVLERYKLTDRYPSRAPTDAFTRGEMRRRFGLLYFPRPAEHAN